MTDRPKQNPRPGSLSPNGERVGAKGEGSASFVGGWGDELDALAPPPVDAGRAPVEARESSRQGSVSAIGERAGARAATLPHASGEAMTELELPADTGPALELDWGDRGSPESRAPAYPELPLPDIDAPPAPRASAGASAAATARARGNPGGMASARALAWTPSPARDTQVIAGMGKRIVAHIVDSFAVGGMTYGLIWVWLRSQTRRFETATHITESQANDLLVSVLGVIGVVTVLGLLYYVLPTTIWGWSPGKKLMGLKVVDDNGDTPSLGRVVLREVLGKWISSMFCSFGYFMAFFDPEHRALHDRIATTTVVED
ncbi:MAG: RDD family protein [Deltaproteobacteria bacterium]|nr:RDD family protein [Deltaproteobacteria bacterium]